jgi:hypothetical protein
LEVIGENVMWVVANAGLMLNEAVELKAWKCSAEVRRKWLFLLREAAKIIYQSKPAVRPKSITTVQACSHIASRYPMSLNRGRQLLDTYQQPRRLLSPSLAQSSYMTVLFFIVGDRSSWGSLRSLKPAPADQLRDVLVVHQTTRPPQRNLAPMP